MGNVMKKKIVLIIIICFSFSPVLAKEKNSNRQYFTHQSLFGKPFLDQEISINFSKIEQTPKIIQAIKSPHKGFLFSLAIPGLGEMYSRSKIKAYIFLGIEAAAWFSYALHKKKGNDWKNEYKEYAENTWDQNHWQNWWNSLSSTDQKLFPRYELPEVKNDEYYEMIGKYDKFNVGWKDVNGIPGLYKSDVSEASLYYMDLRQNSNSEFKLASTSTAIIFINHVLSSLDAVWSVKKFNKSFKATSKLDYVLIDDQPTMLAGVSVDW